jgi:selenophosphate synthase
MTKEEIFALAEKADLYLASDDSVINFAKLVAEKEREECAKVCEQEKDIDGISTAKAFAEIIRARGQE